MKLIKPLTVLSLSALLSVGAYAEQAKQKPAEQKPTQQKPVQQKPVQQKAQPAKTQAKPAPQNTTKAPVKQLNAEKAATPAPKAAAPAANSDAKLKEFSRSIGLKFEGVRVVQQNNQTYVSFGYVLTNNARRSIKNVHWTTNYVAGNQVILTQDVPLSFTQPIKPKQSLPLTFSVAWERLSPAAQQVFAEPNAQVSALFQAKSLTFSNNRKIVVE